MPSYSTTNPKRLPIPVVPMTMKIVNPDGTPTRSGQLLLEQLQSLLPVDMSGGPPGTGGGGGGGPTWTLESDIPSGAMNGTNTAFTLAMAPDPADSLVLFLNGVEQLPGTDYTISGVNISYIVPPKATDWQIAWYGRFSTGTGGTGGGSASGITMPLVLPIRTTAVNTTVANSDYTVVATAASITITLPSAPVTGQLCNVKNGNTTVGMLITVTSGSSALIDQAATLSLGATSSLEVQWDGTQWRIL